MNRTMHHGLLWFCAVLMVLTASHVYASGYALSGVGSKAIGMGGAFRGLADDYSAAYWNPAGLTIQDGFDLSFTGIGIIPNFTVTPQIPVAGYAQDTREAKNDAIFIPNAAFFTDVGDLSWLKFGLGVYVPAGLATAIDLYDLPDGFGNPNAFPEYEWESELQIIDLHPAVAASLLDGKLNVGVGASIQHASAILQRPSLQPVLQGVPLDQLPPEIAGLLGQVAESAQRFMAVDTRMEGDGWAYGLNAGVLLKPISSLSVGVSGRMKSTLSMDGDATVSLYTPGNAQLAGTLAAIPVPAVAKLSALFGGQVFADEGIGTTEVILPADIGIGVAWEPIDTLTLTGDVTWTGWSDFEELRIELEDIEVLGQPITERLIPEMWDDVIRFSAGAEFRLSDQVALRAGYYLDPTPIPEETQGPLIPDIGDKHSINAGLGVNVGSLSIDLNYEYIMWPDRQVESLDANDDGEIDSFAAEYTMDLHSVMTTVSFSF